MNKAYLLIGGNMGDRLANLQHATACIEQSCGNVLQTSAIYETEAWGFKDQPSFYNQALIIASHLSASALMTELLTIELQLGRIRSTPLGPRTIDLDIIYFNDEIIQTDSLLIPHPRLSERNFVLMPLVEIAPNYMHPVLHKSNTLLLKECGDISAVYKKTIF